MDVFSTCWPNCWSDVFIADVLSEEVILKWYKEGHSVKGKMLFLDQMKKFIEWLQNAEEGEQERSNMRSTYSVQ
jgi:hypothetical protein